jgi:hypothetical protein
VLGLPVERVGGQKVHVAGQIFSMKGGSGEQQRPGVSQNRITTIAVPATRHCSGSESPAAQF